MFWITFDPPWGLYASTVLSLHFITHQSTNPLASSKGAEMEKQPLAHWSGLIRMITLQWKRPSAEWCSSVDCLVCGRPQWRTRWRTGTTAQTGPLGLNETGSRVETSFSQGLIEISCFQVTDGLKKKKKVKRKYSKVLTGSEVYTTSNKLYDIVLCAGLYLNHLQLI